MYNTSIVLTVTTLFAVLLTTVIGLSESAASTSLSEKTSKYHLSATRTGADPNQVFETLNPLKPCPHNACRRWFCSRFHISMVIYGIPS